MDVEGAMADNFQNGISRSNNVEDGVDAGTRVAVEFDPRVIFPVR